MAHFHAGYNMPGYMPETPYETFDKLDDAREYLVDTFVRFNDMDETISEDEYNEALEDLKASDNGIYFEPNNLVYNMYPCNDDCNTDDDDN